METPPAMPCGQGLYAQLLAWCSRPQAHPGQYIAHSAVRLLRWQYRSARQQASQDRSEAATRPSAFPQAQWKCVEWIAENSMDIRHALTPEYVRWFSLETARARRLARPVGRLRPAAGKRRAL